MAGGEDIREGLMQKENESKKTGENEKERIEGSVE